MSIQRPWLVEISDEKNKRFMQYLRAILPGIEARIYDLEPMKEWLANNSVAGDDASAEFLSCHVYRMLKMIDSISAVHESSRPQPRYEEGFGEQWISQMSSLEVSLITAKWGGKRTSRLIDKLTDRVGRTIRNAPSIVQPSEDPVELYEIFAGGFELIPSFGLFPVYLLDERLYYWGVLPFGNITAIGMAMNQDALEKLFPELEDEAEGQEIQISLPQMKSAIGKAIEIKRLKFLYFGPGHAAPKILFSLLQAADYQRLRTHLEDFHSFRVGSDRAKIKRQVIAALEETTPNLWVLLTDLGDPIYSAIRAERPGNIARLRLNLDRPLPVGIGFSLVTAAVFLKNLSLLGAISRSMHEYLTGIRGEWKNFAEDGLAINEQHLAILSSLSSLKQTEAPATVAALAEVARRDIQAIKEEALETLASLRQIILVPDKPNRDHTERLSKVLTLAQQSLDSDKLEATSQTVRRRLALNEQYEALNDLVELWLEA
jgi:hypothetical protein